jgi:hypothetical protein
LTTKPKRLNRGTRIKNIMLEDRMICEMRKDKISMDKNSKNIKKNEFHERKRIMNGKALRYAGTLLECTHLLEVVTEKGECKTMLPEKVRRITKAISNVTSSYLTNHIEGRRTS